MESNTNTWNIFIDKERDILAKELINIFINAQNKCLKYEKGNISLFSFIWIFFYNIWILYI